MTEDREKHPGLLGAHKVHNSVKLALDPWHGRPARGKRDLTWVWIMAGTAMPRFACECLGGMRFPRYL
jgi:hypothetical protein